MFQGISCIGTCSSTNQQLQSENYEENIMNFIENTLGPICALILLAVFLMGGIIKHSNISMIISALSIGLLLGVYLERMSAAKHAKAAVTE
ncbi:MAG: hypothetical protein JWO73_104 [Candidatus Taylorbacteria bacterium]|nr:hypothetical protein [Candidatus Taylorbacteria bacterium]